MSRAVANTLLPAKRPASTIARPRPRELPVTNHTSAIQSSYLRSPSYFETARAAGNTVQQEITIARPAERRAVRKRMSYLRFSDQPPGSRSFSRSQTLTHFSRQANHANRVPRRWLCRLYDQVL